MTYGVDLIKKYEGFSAKAYKCPAGVWTIGYGSTKWEDGSPVKQGQTITKEKAEGLLIDYLNKNVRPKLNGLGLNQNQTSAIESLVYNVGPSFFRSKCFAAMKEKNWPEFIKQYDWFKAGGKVLPGLLRRRTEELALFFS